MKPPHKTGNFSTSFLDVILGALGAFFLLLILVSVSHRGDVVNEGSRLSSNYLYFQVNRQNFVFNKHIRFFVAIYDENSVSGPFSDICFSEHLKDGAQSFHDGASNTPRLKVSPDYQMTFANKDRDAPNVLICVWLADWPSVGSVKPLLSGSKDGSISIQVGWNDKDYGTLKTIELNKDNGFATVFFLTGRETQSNLISDAMKIISYRKFAMSHPNWEEMKRERNLPEKEFKRREAGAPDDKWWLFVSTTEPLGMFKNVSSNFNEPKGKPNFFYLMENKRLASSDSDFGVINRSVNNLVKATSQTEISYVASGTRATCVRFKEDKRTLYVCPREDWENKSDFVEYGILTPVTGEGQWYQFKQSEVVERYRELFPAEIDDELVLNYWADTIASPIYETNSPLTQVSPLVTCTK